MIAAAKAGDLARLQALLAAGGPVDAAGMWGNTPMLFAAQYGHHHAALYLLQHGASPDARNNRGATPLLYGCSEGLADFVEQVCCYP